jgi:hypothetical protein
MIIPSAAGEAALAAVGLAGACAHNDAGDAKMIAEASAARLVFVLYIALLSTANVQLVPHNPINYLAEMVPRQG